MCGVDTNFSARPRRKLVLKMFNLALKAPIFFDQISILDADIIHTSRAKIGY